MFGIDGHTRNRIAEIALVYCGFTTFDRTTAAIVLENTLYHRTLVIDEHDIAHIRERCGPLHIPRRAVDAFFGEIRKNILTRWLAEMRIQSERKPPA